MKLEDLLRFIKVREVVFVVGWFIEMILLNNENVGNDLNGDIKCEKCDGWVEIHFPEIPNIIKVETSCLYFRVKLCCVCLICLVFALFALCLLQQKKTKERKKSLFSFFVFFCWSKHKANKANTGHIRQTQQSFTLK